VSITTEERTGTPIAATAARCAPEGEVGMDVESADRLAGVLGALAEPTRLRLVSLVAVGPGGQACVCDLTDPVGLTQPTVSHHLKVLVDAGILEREQRGKWAHFSLVPGALEAAAGGLTAVGMRARSGQGPHDDDPAARDRWDGQTS
jgi:ArsR family transcriptional regulator